MIVLVPRLLTPSLKCELYSPSITQVGDLGRGDVWLTVHFKIDVTSFINRILNVKRDL